MKIVLKRAVVEGVGKDTIKRWLDTTEDRYYDRDESIDLTRLTNESVKALLGTLKPFDGKVPGVRAVLRDIKVWIEAAEKGVDKAVCKTAQSFAGLAFEFIRGIPSRWLYSKSGSGWGAVYVNEIRFHPREKTYSGGTIPAHTKISVCWNELGSRNSGTYSLEDGDVRGKTVVEILAARGLVVESDDLRRDYEEQMASFVKWHDKIGMQFLGRGSATDMENRYTVRSITLDKDGEPARLVVDVLAEEGEDQRSDKVKIDTEFWNRTSLLADKSASRDKPTSESEESDGDPGIEIPTLPVIPMFDLKRHARFKVHVANLEEYVYDPSIGRKLILPQEVTDLVALLVSDKSEFRDIVASKGGGAVILCAGPAGCGKTLTAEVYAEVMGKPLYSVQCSQLGTKEEALEKELLRVFERSQRWGSILLLDEADVYVRARGTELKQNAIVGVFLRVLEYYGGVLFMTTNRSDSVDDAITSRCLARIDYTVPTPENQRRIWTILAEGSGLTVPPEVVERVVTEWPRLSGRDVKQLLKLSAKVLHSRGKDILDFETVKFVKRFKPTPGNEEQVASTAGKRLIPAEAR